MKKKKNKIIVLLLVFSFVVMTPGTHEFIWADSAKDKLNEAQDKLNDVKNEIDNIKDKQDEVEGELSDVRTQLADLLEKQETLEADIAQTQVDIEKTQAELAAAETQAEKQYEAMVIRIQYMYENSTTDSFWTALIEADGLADLVRRVEYMNTLHKSDKELTQQYQQVVATVEAKEEELLVKMDEMLMKQEAYLGQQFEIQEMIASLEDIADEYATELAAAEELAKSYKQTIAEQEEIIRRKEEEEKNNIKNEHAGDKNVSGEDLVAYALQFVGNPYVWGGNSLTNGCDCSGFVHLIYKNFGYNTVRYSMSFLYEGTPVDYEDMLPGDVIVYTKKNGIGHVGIYIGNGKIVEAQSSAKGITSNRAANCREIAGIRRILINP